MPMAVNCDLFHKCMRDLAVISDNDHLLIYENV